MVEGINIENIHKSNPVIMDVSLYSGEKEGLRRGRQEGQAGRVRGPLHTDRRMTCLGSSWYEL